MSDGHEEEGIIVEFVSLGNSVKVTAIDSRTLKEATIVGSTKATRKQLTDLAVRKLHYVMGKEE